MNNDLLIKSQFLQIIEDGDSAVIWHSLFGYPKIVSKETVEFINLFSTPQKINEFLSDDLSDEEKTAIEELTKSFFLIPYNFDDRIFLNEKIKERENKISDGSLIDYLELIMSEACNFRCTYCIHFNNIETSERINNSKKFMKFEMAKEVIDNYIEILRKNGKTIAEINFGGGEPLLAWKVIEQVLEYCNLNYYPEFNFRFSINTNASLITRDIADKLKKFQVEISSSLDGLNEGNDKVRLTKTGQGTFSQIIKGFDTLEAVGYPLDGFSVTVNETNFSYLDESVIDWAISRKMKDVRIDIDVINMIKIPVETIISKLVSIRRYAKKKGIDLAGFWARPAENLNESTLDSHVAFCGAVRGNSMCVGPSGNIYGCGYSTIQLGTLGDIKLFYEKDSIYYRFVKDHYTGVMEMCKGCMIEGQCGGGCNITQEFAKITATAKIERMCDFYRLMTKEILKEQLKEAVKT